MIAGLSFFNLWALGFLVLVPLLILLYFLKLKRPQIKVASTLLWQKVVEDMRVNSPFQKLRKNLLLLLQLILLLLLIFALARPWLKSMEDKEESYIVLLDVSASMAAREKGGKTRLELAKAEIEEQISQLHHKSEMMLLAFDKRATIARSFTNNQKLLREALQKLEAGDVSTDAGMALRIAASVGGTRPNPKLLLYSDGGFPDPGKLELPMKVEFHAVGTEQSNLAITQMNVRRSASKPEQLELFVAVNNYSKQKFDGEMKVMLDEKMLDSKFFEIEGGKSLSQVFQAELEGSGTLSVEFDVDDAMQIDNRAVQVVPEPRRRRVLLISDNPFYVERALRTIKSVDLTSISPEEFPSFAGEEYTTAIWVAVADPQVAAANNIYFGCYPEVPGISSAGTIKGPDVADWDSTHPINRFIDFSNLVIGETMDLKLPPSAHVLISSTHHPLAAVIDEKDRSLVITGFDLYKSSWPFQVTLLYFIRNSLDYFDIQHQQTVNTNIPVGGIISVRAQHKAPQVRTPDGQTIEMTAVADGGYAFNDLDRVGIYEVTNLIGGKSRKYAVNLFSRQESELLQAGNPITDRKEVVLAGPAKKVSKEYFRELLILALIFLIIEWIVYHRRILS